MCSWSSVSKLTKNRYLWSLKVAGHVSVTCAVTAGGDTPFSLGGRLRVCRILVGVRDGWYRVEAPGLCIAAADDIVELR